MAGKYWWEDVDQDDKKQQGSGQTTSQDIKSQGYWWEDDSMATMVGNNIYTRVNTWIKNHNNYISDYQKRYSGRKYNYEDAYVKDSARWLDTVSRQKSTFDAESKAILDYMDQYKAYLDEDWMKSIRETLTGASDKQKSIIESATKDNEWWSSFGNEELVKEYGSAEDAYKYFQRDDGYRKKYTGLTSDDLYGLVGNLDDGEEKNWLTSYASSVDYDEKSKLDLDTAMKEIEDMENFYDNAFMVETWYTGYQMNPGAWTDEEISRNMELYNTLKEKYGSIDDLEKLLSKKKAYLDDAKKVQQLESMSAVSGNADFAGKSKYVNNVEYGLLGKPEFTDNTYAYINNPTVEDKRPLGAGDTTARALIGDEYSAYSADSPLKNRDSSYVREALEYIKPEEAAIYNYYYATEGPEKAGEYLDLLVETFQARKDADTVAKTAQFAGKHPVLASALSVGTSIGSGFEYLEDIIEYGGDKLMGKDAKLGTNESSLVTNAVRGTVADMVDWNVKALGNWDAFDFIYNTTMSGVDSLASTAFGGMGGTVLGLSAAAQGTNDALNRGMSDGQAFWNGLLSGVFEGLFETISIGNFNKLKDTAIKVGLKNIDKTVIKTIAMNIGKSMLVNASEEMLTELANITYDTLVNGEFANYTLEELFEEGEWKKALNQVIESGASGAFMGMGMSALGSAIGHKKGVKAANEYAVKNYGGQTDAFIQEGLESDVKSNSYKLATKYQKKVDGGKTLTGQQIRNLLAANQEQITPKDLKLIQSAAEKRLTALGQTKDVQRTAELATKRATGQRLTRDEKSFLANSEYGARVANELLPENIASEDYSTDWAEEIGTKKVNAFAYNKKAITRAIVEAMSEDPTAYKSLESRTDGETPAKVSNTGKSVIRATGEEIDLTNLKIKEITKDRVVLDVNGKAVDTEEIDFATEDQWNAFNAIKNIEHITPVAASSMIAKVDFTQPIWKQLNGMDEAFTYGYYNYSEADLKAGLFTESLTKDQLNDAYKLGQYVAEKSQTDKAERFKAMRTAAQAEAEKAEAEGKGKPQPKNLTITYNMGGGKVVSIDEAGITDPKRSGAVEVAKILHQLGLGTKVEFFTSFESDTLTVKDRKGNTKKARAFINDAGVEQIAYSGVYRKSDGTIRVDLNAYNGRGLTLDALAHELTHFIQQWSDRKYKVLVDFLMKTYESTDMTMHQRVLAHQKFLQETRNEEVSYDEAYDEVVANAMMKMFDDGKLVERLTELKAVDKNLAQKLWERFKQILSEFLGIYEKEGALFKDTYDIMQMKETFEQLQNMFAEALVEASENYQTYLTASENQILIEAGIGFDENTRSVYALHFSNAYTEQIQVGKKTFDAEAISQLVAKATGRNIEDARKWVKSEMAIANIVMQNPEFLDFEADDRYEAIKKNSDYPQGTVDLSNLCPKREEFTAMFDMLQKKYPNKLFTAQDVAEMRKILAKNNITVACGACFVEDRRQLLGEIADTYINMWKEAVESGKPLQKTNAEGVKSDLLVTKALAKQYGLTPGTKIMATDTYIPNQYDLTTYEGFKLLEKNHPTIAMGFNRYNNSRGQQSARLIEGRAEYNRQILGWSEAKVRSVNNNGGLRIFSFSDFEVVHLLDLVQVIIDCAAKGVKIQGYTKIPAFAKLVSGTGIKLNRSHIPQGDYGYHMENGKVVLDCDTTEGINTNDKNFMDESDNPDVGDVIIGINPTQISAAMLDPFFDYIIPFHSNKAKDSLKKLGTGEWVNYKESQHEKDISTGKASKRNVNIYTEVINKYHPTNKVEFVEAFLNECKRQGKIPRYAEFLNVDANGDYAYREGYHKLLVDFKMFDAEGNILPQGNITPNLDETFLAELLNAEIDKKQNYEFPQKVYDAIDKQFGEQYSSQETDRDSDGNLLSKSQQQYFADSKVRDAYGRLMVMYHGTANGGAFTVFDGDKLGNDTRTSQIGQGFYFTNMKSEAKSYTKNVDIFGKVSNGSDPHLHQVYLNITNPFDISADKLDMEKVKAVYMDGTYEYFFNSWIPFYLDKKSVNGGLFTKAEVQAMSKSEKVSAYVEYLSRLGTKEILSNMVRAFPYGKQSVLLASMKKHLGYDGLVEEFKPGQFQYVAFSSDQIKNVDNKTPTINPDIRYSSQETDRDRQQYNAFREKFAKERLDQLSDKLGDLFPLSAGFEQAIQKDKTPVSNMTIVANSQKRGNGESYYTAGKNAFKKLYGGKTTFSIKQLGISAEADSTFAKESMSKVSDRKDLQTILDLTPMFKQLIEESRLLAVERLIHNDTKNKKESLLCYRLYNAYIREETYIDANGSKQTHKVPHIVVFSVIQNLADAKAHMVTDIKDVAISNGPNSSKLHAAHANGNISIGNIADVYGVVKSIDRKKGGLRYSSGEMSYKFDYSQKENGEVYSSQETDADYMKAVNSGYIALAQEMVLQAAYEAGHRYAGLHGTQSFGFTKFDRKKTNKHGAHYVTDKYRIAESYSGVKGKTSISSKEARGNYFVTVDMKKPLVVECHGSLWNNIPFDIGKNGSGKDGKVITDDIVKYAEKKGYDGVIFKNLVDPGHLTQAEKIEILHTDEGRKKWTSNVYAVFNSNQIKSLDPVTYDDKGKVIPLSERFNRKKDDIRYSSQETDLDSNGKKLGEDQLEYFEKSNVRDRNGRLQVVYHGGTVEFEFDTTRGGKGATQYGPGAYFTDSEYYAKEYTWYRGGNVKDYYLNIEKMFDDTNMDATVQMPQWKKLEHILRSNGIEDKFINKFKEGGFAYMSRYLALKAGAKTSSSWEGSEQLNAMLREAGFDGIKGELNDVYQYVIFTPNQAKLTTNEVPSTFYDTRYSSQETDIDTSGMDDNAKEVIHNLKIRAMSSRYRKGVYASYSAERIVRELNSSSANKMDYAKSYIAWVEPLDFLYATTISQENREQIEKEAGELDLERLRKQTQPIHLTVDFETGKIVGHEGRHRMIALYKAGVNKVAVIFDAWNDDRYNTKPVDMMRIGGQEFDKYHGGIDFYVHDMLPLSKRYADAAKKLFSEVDGSVRFSEHDTDYSNRSLLANAFEGITKNSEEYKMIQEYKGHIRLLNEYEEKLDKLNAEIREIRFTSGKYDAEKLHELEAEAKEIAGHINRHDRKLLQMEASGPLRKVIEQERKKEAQKTKAHVKEIQQNKKLRADQTELRHKIRKAIRDLDKILNRGNKKQNVKEDMQNVVSKALQAADILFTDNYGTYDMLRNGLGVDLSDSEEALVKTCTQMLKDLDKMPTDGYENWQARQEAENRLRTKMSKLSEVFARERKRLNNATVSSILSELADAYKSLETSDQSYVQGAYSEPVYNFLKNLQTEVGGAIVNDMTKDQLESVYAAYKMVLNTVRNANKMFNEELKQSREQLGNAVIEEVLKAGGVHLLGTKMGDAASQFSWNNMKPIWVANRIGSDTFSKLMGGLFKGQYNFAVDIDEAKKFKLEMDKKYSPRNWDAEKQYKFTSSTGKEFSLNLQQIMSLYAFSKREQAYSHLLNGGFVFEDNSTVVVDGKLGIKKTYIHKGAASYKLNDATLNGIINSLTAEQKAYVDEMQKYLSDVMGAKGNEVSMQLYGIKMFNEQFYFPLRSSGAYMERAKEAEMKKQQGQINLVNSGFTHAVKPEAKNPIILAGFMDVWAEHCNEMSMYHSMVLPMEDFRKVYNYSTIHDEKMESASVYQTIQDAYGKAATNYIDQLYRELNAGATVDPRETPWKKLISNFKKAAVMLSGSVVVQQFSSIGRAYAVIDPKYFIGTKVDSDTKLSVVEEMKKYAPVAIIKEMGGFDTGTKGSAKSYIMAEQYGKGERIKGFVKDAQYRGDLMGFLPAWADEKTWCAIWEAAKRQTKAKNPKMDVKSEAFLKLAGELFSETIEKTQVYDSVLARSANMRSKGNFMAMATAFMAEPTATVNLLEDAIRSGSAKNIARAFGSVAVAIVLNNALASIVYAMRDDDEDETFLEKYFQSFTSGMIDDINPMSYYPFLKDVYSLFQGYDVERADMSVIADVRDAMKRAVSLFGKDTSEMDDEELAKHYKQVNEVLMGLLDAGCSMFGVPVKNVRRDAMGIINAWNTIGTDLSDERDNSWISFWDKVGAAAKDTIPIYAWTKDKAKGNKLYDAIISGDKDNLARLKSTYNTDESYHSAVRKALRESDSRVKEAAQAHINGDPSERVRIAKLIIADGFDLNDVILAINAEINDMTHDDSTSDTKKEKGLYKVEDFVREAVNGDETALKAIREDILQTAEKNGKTAKEAEEDFVSDVKSAAKKEFIDGSLSEAQAEKILSEHTDMDEEEVAARVSYWAFIKAHPDYENVFNESSVAKYYEFGEPAGISVEMYAKFIEGTKGLADIKDEWGDVEISKQDQFIEVIDSLPLTWQQKDALFLTEYAESSLWKVSW